MKYVYPAVFYKDKNLKDTYSVIFPDVEGAATCGHSLYEALEMAEEALADMLVEWEDKTCANRITEPTPLDKIVAEPDEYSSQAFVTLIKADTDEYREKLKNLPDDVVEPDDDFLIPDTLAKEIFRIAGIKDERR